MASGIAFLRVELLQPILEELTITDISRLQQCSKLLNTSLGPLLFSSATAVNRLMRWGCLHGDRWAIEKALTYGANISVVDCDSYRTITLYLAARRHHYDTFKFLLESGARGNVKGTHRRQRRMLRKCLFNPRTPELLHLYLQYHPRDQIRQFQAGLDQALPSSVKLNLSLETCRTWFDLGAHPTTLINKNNWYPKSVLALAILSGSISLTRVLLSKKPNLSLLNRRLPHPDPRVEDRVLLPWEAIPMLAAARHMAINGTTSMLDLLLEAGGDINNSIISDPKDFGTDRFATTRYPSDCIVTPLLTYLLTINIDTDLKGIEMTPSQGVKYLLDQGAKIEQPRFIGVRVRRREYPTLLQLLWKTWGGLNCLLNDEAYAVLKLIVKNGAAKGEVAEFLLPSSLQLSPSPGTKATPFSSKGYHAVVERWEGLLDLMLQDQNFENGLSCEIDDLFFQFIITIFYSTLNAGTRLPDPCPTEMLYQYMDETHPTTIQKFLEKGANINMKINRHDFHGSLLGSIYHRHAWGLNLLQRRRQRSFVSMLISLGAEPFTPAREGGVDDTDPLQRQWLAALRGEVREEDRTLWKPRSSLLFEDSYRHSA